MERQVIPAGWLTLRPFTAADVPWVYEVSLDPEVGRFVWVGSLLSIDLLGIDEPDGGG